MKLEPKALANFIVFEGGEGTGKTRHTEELAQRLRTSTFDVLVTREPGGSAICSAIRNIILAEQDEQLSSRAELFLFLADRAQHVEQVIRPALDAGKIVICDRFSGSTLAYQLGGRQLADIELVLRMDAYARQGIEPDLVLYLDMPVEAAMERKKEGREEMNRMDNQEIAFHKRVRGYFQKLTQENESWHSLSTEGPKEENADKIEQLIRKELGL